MSEIAKCPHCGEEPDILIDLFDKYGKYPKGYICCGAEFVELDRWNQYAAAMELAKLTVQMKTCRAYCPERAFLYAQDRVLEVFNE